jgi:hypothetical protein
LAKYFTTKSGLLCPYVAFFDFFVSIFVLGDVRALSFLYIKGTLSISLKSMEISFWLMTDVEERR